MVETIRVGATNGVGGLVAQVVTTVDPTTLLPSVPPGSVVDSTGGTFNPDNMQQTLTNDASGNLISIAATNGVNTWTQTVTYPTATTTVFSQWVKS